MLHDLVQIVGWLVAICLGVVTLLLAFNRQTGLRLIQHRVEMLPQAMLVRYGALTLLAVIGSWLGTPVFLFAVLIAFSAIGFGDAFIYRRADLPFRLHLVVGGVALFGALLALIANS
ncbi:hypothetical protein PAF17_01180 [Paracoccus sp. Z330]|uniref:DUF4345 domain-containing protein n=1 Tax=Paracoccus onchidii TaxID=3017813 RepID=A0ABT4ZAF5_9RHOB|nr:hypothetical protein [Paracoccus onchidii]MDB6176117.1 hypothetical protein [Paracoccus onchidii]